MREKASDETIPVLVVGAGPVGLTMAAELTRHGVATRIVDRNAVPSDKSKALAVWSRTLEMLDDMGIGGDFLATGIRAVGSSIYGENRRLAHLAFNTAPTPHPYALMLPQCETERLLASHLEKQGVHVGRALELADLHEDADAITVTLRHAGGAEEIVRCRWLLACDGAHSTIRHTLNIPFHGDADPNDWFLADVHIRGGVPEDEMSMFLHEKGAMAIFPMGRGRFRLMADGGAARGEDRAPDPTLDEIRAILDERGPGGWTPHDPVWLSSFRIHECKVADYRHGRVFLAGDAAHVHSPAGGQGMNTGMQDAYNLAWKLALVERGRGRAEPLLQSYSAERSPVGELVLKRAAAFTRMATLRNPIAQHLRNRLASLLASFEVVQHRLGDQFAELSIAYPKSPILGEHSGRRPSWLRGGVAPGGRAPDAALRIGASGRPTTLFELLRGTSHVVLLLEGVDDRGSNPALANLGATVRARFGDLVSEHLVLAPGHVEGRSDGLGAILTDPTGELHERYGASGPSAYLIRPDGYVGFRSQPADEGHLLEHLGSYLIPRADRAAA
jgi:2-polyprenyl-6-methoxyphenol hydroxylase-like FAD-dependent oxidoreductase